MSPEYLTPAENETGILTVGGLPGLPSSTTWPECAQHEVPMRYTTAFPLAGVHRDHADKTILVFQCSTDPGDCDDWDITSGSNAAIVAAAGLPEREAPASTNVVLDGGHVTLKVVSKDEVTEDTSVVGTLGGEPDWYQSDDTPACRCGEEMDFVGQLAEWAHEDLNFGGGGMAYIFFCTSCGQSAAWTWQR